MTMRLAGSPAEFMAAPVGRYLRGHSFIVWVLNPELLGVLHFGPLDSSDRHTLDQVFRLPGHPALAARYDAIYDLGFIEAFDQTTFALFETFLEGAAEHLAERARRLAVIRPDGVMGATVSGVYHHWIAPLRLNARLFLDREQAEEWLGLAEGSPERAAIDALRGLLSPSPLLRTVREVIQRELREATLTSVANAMGLTPRTLQRQLAAARSSFRDEIMRARIRAAEEMLVDGDDKIERIARAVGFRSTAAFTVMFQRLEGVSPSEFRARRHVRPSDGGDDTRQNA